MVNIEKQRIFFMVKMAEMLIDILPMELVLEIETFLDWNPVYKKVMEQFEIFGKKIRECEITYISMPRKFPMLKKWDDYDLSSVLDSESLEAAVRNMCHISRYKMNEYIREANDSKMERIQSREKWKEKQNRWRYYDEKAKKWIRRSDWKFTYSDQ